MADRNRNEAGTRKTEEVLAEIEHSDTVKTSIDAFKLIRFDKWVSCRWGRMTGCKEVFRISEFEKWVAHTKKVHLSREERQGARSIYIGPPASNYCGFCAAKFEADSRDLSWSNMMAHVVQEHHMLGHRLAHARIVWPLVEYLWENGLLTSTQYRDLKPIRNAWDVPPSLGFSDDEDPIALAEERRY